jgi:hypothetical protein
MLRKEVLPARLWDPCRRHEDRSPPIVGFAPMLVFALVVMAILGGFVWRLVEDDRQAEQQHQRALEMEIRANIRAVEELDRRPPAIHHPKAVGMPTAGDSSSIGGSDWNAPPRVIW